MQLTLKLYAGLSSYLPREAEGHSVMLDVHSKETPHMVLNRYQVPQEKVHLVLLNGVYLSADQRENTVFNQGDVLAVWPPVAGG